MCVLLSYYFSRQAHSFLKSIPTHPPPPKWSINRPNALNLIYFRWRRCQCMCIKDLPAFSEYDQIRPIPPLMLPQILSLSLRVCVCLASDSTYLFVLFLICGLSCKDCRHSDAAAGTAMHHLDRERFRPMADQYNLLQASGDDGQSCGHPRCLLFPPQCFSGGFRDA